MKEILTVELDRNDIEDAIYSFLKGKGYEAKKVDFSFKHFSDATKVNGASVTVIKEEFPDGKTI